VFLFAPLFVFVKDPHKIKTLNTCLTFLCYLPVTILITPFYILTNLLLSPLAYLYNIKVLKSLIHKEESKNKIDNAK
jgi:hypothetical protein